MKKNNIKTIKYSIAIIILAMVTIQAYRHQVLGGGVAPSVHAVCPYGALESFYSLITSGAFLKKVFSSALILFIGSVIISIVFGRSFCGVICPFGTLQDIFGKLGRVLFKNRHEIGEAIDKKARILKYLVLIISTLLAWTTYTLWVAPYDPWSAYAHLSTGEELLKESPVGLALLILVLVFSVIYERVFCKYLCPMGAFLAITSKFSMSKITRDEKSCVNCKLCDKACPMNIKVSESKEVKSGECINCGNCVLACPKENTLTLKFKGKKVSIIKYIVLVVVTFMVLIFTTKAIGVFNEVPKKISKGEINTEFKVEEIKGYMTLKEVSEMTNIPIEKIYEKLGFTKEKVPEDTKIKEIGKVLNKEFEAENIREIIKEILKDNK